MSGLSHELIEVSKQVPELNQIYGNVLHLVYHSSRSFSESQRQDGSEVVVPGRHLMSSGRPQHKVVADIGIPGWRKHVFSEVESEISHLEKNDHGATGKRHAS